MSTSSRSSNQNTRPIAATKKNQRKKIDVLNLWVDACFFMSVASIRIDLENRLKFGLDAIAQNWLEF